MHGHMTGLVQLDAHLFMRGPGSDTEFATESGIPIERR